MAPQVAKRLGLRVIGLLGSQAQPTYASGFGAGHLIDLSMERDWAAAVAALTGGRGVDLIVDGDAGSASTRPFEVIARGGEGVFIDATSGAPAAPAPPEPLIVKHAAMREFNLDVALDVAEGLGAPSQRVDDQILPLLRSGEVKLPLTSVSPFESSLSSTGVLRTGRSRAAPSSRSAAKRWNACGAPADGDCRRSRLPCGPDSRQILYFYIN